MVDTMTDTTHLEDSSQQSRKEDWSRRMRRWIAWPSLWVSIVLTFVTAVSFLPAIFSFSIFSPDINWSFDGIAVESGLDGVQLSGNVTRFDWSDPTKVSVTWGVFGHGKYAFQIRDYFYDSLASVTLDVCFNDPSKPVFSYDPTLLPVNSDGEELYLPSLYTFTMEHNIDYGYQYPAPDDQYTFSVLTFVIEPATNESIPILELLLFDSGPGDLTTETNVTRHLTSQFTYDAGSGPTTVVAISEALHVTIVRSASARVLTYSVFAINWILEFCSVITTIAAFSRRGGKSDVGITLLPVTVVLSIPAIRNLFVGSPPFGIYLDVVGFFPQMLIVASCTAVILSGHVLKSIWGEGARTKEKRGLRPKDIQ